MTVSLTAAERDRLRTVIVEALNETGIEPDARGMRRVTISPRFAENGCVAFALDDLAQRLHDAIAGPHLERIAELEDMLATRWKNNPEDGVKDVLRAMFKTDAAPDLSRWRKDRR